MIKKRVSRMILCEDGAAAYIMAFIMVAALSICALVIDLGSIYVKRASLQTAVDSAALAAAYMLPDTAAATAKANEYIIKNGFAPGDIAIHFEYENSVIKIDAAKRLETAFAKVFSVDYIDINTTASAKRDIKSNEKLHDYLVFTGSKTATLNLGGRIEIYGSVHSNGSLSVSPSYGYIEGSAESSDRFYINTYTTTVGKEVLNAPYIEIPDYSAQAAGVMPSYYETVLTAANVNKISSKQYFTGNTKIIGDCNISNQAVISGNLYIEGNLTINGGAPACVLNGNIYATGSINFTNTFSGSGCVIAKKNVSFQGSGAQFAAGSPICIYSETGNISLSTATSEIHGMVIAPKGTVNIQGGTTTFYGSIIADRLTGIPAELKMYFLDFEAPFRSVTAVTRLVK